MKNKIALIYFVIINICTISYFCFSMPLKAIFLVTGIMLLCIGIQLGALVED
jgi:hypothetical protein